MVMIKDNHIAAAGGIAAAVAATEVRGGGSAQQACEAEHTGKRRACHMPTSSCLQVVVWRAPTHPSSFHFRFSPCICLAGGSPRLQDYMHSRGIKRPVEVETRTLEELEEVRPACAPCAGATRSRHAPVLLLQHCRLDAMQAVRGELTVRFCGRPHATRVCSSLQRLKAGGHPAWAPNAAPMQLCVQHQSARSPGRQAGAALRPSPPARLHGTHPPQVLAILDGAGGESMITRIMLDNMTKKDAEAKCECRCSSRRPIVVLCACWCAARQASVLCCRPAREASCPPPPPYPALPG